MEIRKVFSVAWLIAVAIASLFLFNYKPVVPIYGPATTQPVVIPTQPVPAMPETIPDDTNNASQVQPTGIPDKASAPEIQMVVRNQAEIDAAERSALYTQTFTALLLLLGSALLMLIRKYEKPFVPRLSASVVGIAAVAFSAILLWMDWVPSQNFPVYAALLAVIAAAAGPVLQLMAPDQKVLNKLATAEQDLSDAEEDLDEFEQEVEDLRNKIEEAETGSRITGESLTSAAATLRERTPEAEMHYAMQQAQLNSFKERVAADKAAEGLATAEADLGAAKQHLTSLDSDLGAVQAELQRLRTAFDDATADAEKAWTSVEDAATAAVAAETTFAVTQKQVESSQAAIADGVAVVDADTLQENFSAAKTAYRKALETLSRLKQEARAADVAVGRLTSDIASADADLSAIVSDLDIAKSSVEAATTAVDEAANAAEVAELKAVAAEHGFEALVATKQRNVELVTQVAAEQAENAVLRSQTEELKDAVRDALRASGCILSLNRLSAEEDVAFWQINLEMPQSHEVTCAVIVEYDESDEEEDEDDEIFFRTILAGETESEVFPVDRGYDADIHILPPRRTAQALGSDEVAAYLVA